MRLKTTALFAGALLVSVSLHHGARCQTSLAPPLSLAAPPSVAVEDAPPAATDDVAPPPAAARRSRPPATAKDRPPTATLSPTPKPAADYDGFTAGIVDEDASAQATRPAKPRPAQRPKLRQKPDSPEGRSVDQMEDEKLRRSLVICSGCK